MSGDVYDHAIMKWGESAQLRQLQEECAELIVAVSHHERGRITLEQLAEEVADVEIMIEQARRIIGHAVDEALHRKVARLRAVVNGEMGR